VIKFKYFEKENSIKQVAPVKGCNPRDLREPSPFRVGRRSGMHLVPLYCMELA